MEKKLAIRPPPPPTRRRRQKANQDQSMDRNDLKDGEQQQQANANVESLLHELYYDPRHASAYTSIGNVVSRGEKITTKSQERRGRTLVPTTTTRHAAQVSTSPFPNE